MKLNIISTLFLLWYFPSSGQDVKMILQKAYEKCQSVENGHYEMTRFWKSVTKKDTSQTLFDCYFKKLKDDTIYTIAFHSKSYAKGKYLGDVLYTGEDFVTTFTQDSSGTIMPKTKWASEIKSSSHNYKFFSPLTNSKSSPIQHDSALIDNEHKFKFIGEEKINEALCYHIQVNQIPENDSTDMTKVLRIELHYWIKKEDLIPVQYSTAFDLFMHNDTMYQFEKYSLNHYEINNLQDETVLTLNSIPGFYRIKEYVPYKSPELLSKNTNAPDWELPSLTDEKISLKSLQGQLVLLDFFYKSCYPCMQALPALQALSEKYKGNGLRVIGIDPFDKKEEDDLGPFLSKRGVTYTVLLEGKEVANEYHVSGYPTIYLIDKSGKIIYTNVGYGKDLDEILDEIIRKNLP